MILITCKNVRQLFMHNNDNIMFRLLYTVVRRMVSENDKFSSKNVSGKR